MFGAVDGLVTNASLIAGLGGGGVPAHTVVLTGTAALVAGAAYDRSTDKTELAVGAAQWIASGFFVMVLATLLAVALTTVRWFMWRRDQQGPFPPDRSGQDRTGPRPKPDPRRPGTPTPPSAQWPPGSAGGWTRDQRPRSGPRPGSGPYNFSSGA